MNEKREVTILQARQRLGLTQATLAKLSKISRQAIHRWETGNAAEAIKLVPYVQKLNELARHYKVLVEDEEIVGPPVRNHAMQAGHREL